MSKRTFGQPDSTNRFNAIETTSPPREELSFSPVRDHDNFVGLPATETRSKYNIDAASKSGEDRSSRKYINESVNQTADFGDHSFNIISSRIVSSGKGFGLN